MSPVELARATEDSIWQSMFAFQVPPTEKVVRTVLVYAAISVLLRLTGKRQLAQLNTFDLVVALLLSNVVQNAIIGPDNSLVGGVLGAVVLVAVNSLLDRLCLVSPVADRVFNGTDTALITAGRLDRRQLRRVGLTEHELLNVLRRQGADDVTEVSTATISPGGTVVVTLDRDEQAASRGELGAAMAALHRHLDERLDALERRLGGMIET